MSVRPRPELAPPAPAHRCTCRQPRSLRRSRGPAGGRSEPAVPRPDPGGRRGRRGAPGGSRACAHPCRQPRRRRPGCGRACPGGGGRGRGGESEGRAGGGPGARPGAAGGGGRKAGGRQRHARPGSAGGGGGARPRPGGELRLPLQAGAHRGRQRGQDLPGAALQNRGLRRAPGQHHRRGLHHEEPGDPGQAGEGEQSGGPGRRPDTPPLRFRGWRSGRGAAAHLPARPPHPPAPRSSGPAPPPRCRRGRRAPARLPEEEEAAVARRWLAASGAARPGCPAPGCPAADSACAAAVLAGRAARCRLTEQPRRARRDPAHLLTGLATAGPAA